MAKDMDMDPILDLTYNSYEKIEYYNKILDKNKLRIFQGKSIVIS
jgi:hypothetical protein